MNATPWQEALDDLFSSAINQEPLDESLNQVAELTVIDPYYHEEVIGALDVAIGLAEHGSVEMLPAINKSGYGASDANSAHFLLCHVRKIYLEELLKVRKLRAPDDLGS